MVGLALLTDKGDIKPFETFRHDVETVHKRYNHNYLYAEYNHAVGSSLMAARWHQIEADGDRVVIGIKKTVTAAVNAANLKHS